jgi:hypothetical protein
MSRIGELLLEHGWVDQTNLKRALSEQSLAGGKRLCSLLIARGLLDPDHAARALGEQFAVPAVLQRHLEFRERALAEKLPAALARKYIALPIGHTRGGELIVCVRDPSPQLEAVIQRAIEGSVVIAVAPASQLEKLIEESYAATEDANEFDVDLSTGTQIEPPPRSLGDETAMPEFGAFSLVGLDDLRVTKDHSQTISVPSRSTPPPFSSVTPPQGSAAPVRTTLPPATRRAPTSPFSSITPPFASATPPEAAPIPSGSLELDPEVDPGIEDIPPPPPPREPPVTPPAPSPALGTQPPRGAMGGPSKVMIPPIGAPLPRPLKTPTSPQSPVKLTIEAAIAAIADALSRDTATDVAMRYALQRWNASLLLAVKEGAALGHRGHGTHLSADAVRAVAIPLTSPSIVKVAHDTKELAVDPPPGVGAIQERLLRLLGSPRKAVAAPIMVAGRIACVIVVGDPIGHGDSAGDLDKLASALGTTYTRILRDMK